MRASALVSVAGVTRAPSLSRYAVGGIAGLCVLFAAALGGSAAHAERGQVSLSLIPGASVLKTNGVWLWGGGGAVDLRVGVSEALSLRLTGAATSHTVSALTDPSTGKPVDPSASLIAYHAGVGVTYTVDILRLVPTIEASIGLLGTALRSGAQDPTAVATWRSTYDLGVQLGLGLDYLITSRFSVGAVLRYHAYLTHIDSIPAYLYFGPRFTAFFN